MKAGVHFSGGFLWNGLHLTGFIFALSWDPSVCLSRKTSLERKQVFTFALYSTLGIVIGTGDTMGFFFFLPHLQRFEVSSEFFLFK